MKLKYKIAIVTSCIIISCVWGMLGTWLVMKNQNSMVGAIVIIYIAYMVTMIIPVKIIVNKAKQDM